MATLTASVRPYRPVDETAMREITHSLYPDMPSPREGRLNHLLAAFEGEQVVVEVSESANEVIGYALAVRDIGAADGDIYMLELAVNPQYHHRGVGSTLYDRVLTTLRGWGAARAYVWTRENDEPARSFAERRGFEATDRVTKLSRLSVRSANLETLRAVAMRVANEGIRITTLQDLSEAGVHDAYRAMNESMADVPSSEAFVAIPYEQWRAMFLEGPGVGPNLFWVALDHENVVGVAPLGLAAEGEAMNNFTGVVRSHRGRGIARALKVATIEWARDNGIEYIYTGNDYANAPMLAVNTDLGYQQLPSMIEMVRKF